MTMMEDGDFYSSSDSNMSLRAKIIKQTNMVADPEDIAILQDMLGAFGGLGINEDDEEDYVSD
jgi:hypothetical protein